MTGARGRIGATGRTGAIHQLIKRAATEITTESPCVGPEGKQLGNTTYRTMNLR